MPIAGDGADGVLPSLRQMVRVAVWCMVLYCDVVMFSAGIIIASCSSCTNMIRAAFFADNFTIVYVLIC